MNNKYIYITWAVAYVCCVVLGFVPSPEGLVWGLCFFMSLAFFVPPALLLYRAVSREAWADVRLVRNLSIVWLALTLVLLVINLLSVGGSDTAGQVVYVLLILLTSPMVCSQVWVVPIFLWACLLMVCLKYQKRK